MTFFKGVLCIIGGTNGILSGYECVCECVYFLSACIFTTPLAPCNEITRFYYACNKGQTNSHPSAPPISLNHLQIKNTFAFSCIKGNHSKGHYKKGITLEKTLSAKWPGSETLVIYIYKKTKGSCNLIKVHFPQLKMCFQWTPQSIKQNKWMGY